MDIFNNFEEIKRQFYTYDKEKQQFLIYQIFTATALFLDFREKYNMLVRENLHKDISILLRVQFAYVYLFNAYSILYIVCNKNSLHNKMRRIKSFVATLKNKRINS
tara:strand:+ start:136 stop:453 length:318 start_codon:yes stop_codon:yes gene_type:complete